MNELSRTKHLLLFACFLGIVSIGNLVAYGQSSERKVLKRVDPIYPETLRVRGIGGTVRLKVSVRADGKVRDVHVVGGNPVLVESAIYAVRQWRYSPGDGETTAEVVLNFHPTE